MDTTIFFSPYLWWPPSTERPACWAHPWPHAPPPGRCSRAVHPDLESAQPLPSIGGDLLWFLVISGDLWQFLVIYDDSWWFLVNSGDFWWFMLISGGLRWFLVISGDLCWFLVIYDDSKWFLVIHANLFWFMGFMVIYGIYIFKMTYANLWWFMVIHGDFWLITYDRVLKIPIIKHLKSKNHILKMDSYTFVGSSGVTIPNLGVLATCFKLDEHGTYSWL